VRPGLFGQPFTILKFRTMTNASDPSGRLLPDSARLTSLGRFLRVTSLDELPELINVLRGDMSLIGPRPLFTWYLPHYSARERIRHLVRPGITGWAQVSGRNLLGWDKRLAMDVWYVENWSLSLDLRILGRTILMVLSRQGAAPDSGAVETDLAEERTSSVRSKD
jgi:lipopolysaccharide/colanic/teichoic acid biosynthesis glycosyltransferase